MSTFNEGGKYIRDDIIATIIGLQNGLGNDESNPKYQAYQELYELIVSKHGDLFQELDTGHHPRLDEQITSAEGMRKESNTFDKIPVKENER